MSVVSELVSLQPSLASHASRSGTTGRIAAATLAHAWLARSARSPRRTALVFDDQRWTYAELHHAACQAAQQLQRLGLAPGERVILMMDNGPAFLAAFFGCQLMGLVPIPVSPRSSVQRMRYLLDDSEAELVLTEPAWADAHHALHRAQAYGARMVTLEPQHGQWEPLELTRDEDACALIQYTSGACRDSKGAMISHRAVLASVGDFGTALGLGSHDVFASMLPMCDHMGLMCFGLVPLLSGHPLVLYRSGTGNLQAWLAGLGKHRVTVTGATDELLQRANRLVDEPARYDLRRLRMLLCGAEPISSGSVETFGSRFNVLHAIKPLYGMAELTLCATFTPGHEPARIDEHNHVACGRPLSGVDVCIADEDGMLTRKPGVWGEIRVRSPAMMSGYWMRARESADAFDDLGYLRTGDLGYLDAQGCLYVLGRMDSLFVHGAGKHALHDVEAAASDLPAIGRVAVVHSERDQPRLIAVLEVPSLLLQDHDVLKQLWCHYESAARARTGIAPSDCWFIPAGSMPCTENGKPRRTWLRGQIERGRFAPSWACTSARAAEGVAS